MDAAVRKARSNALNLVQRLLEVVEKPDRHSTAVVSAAKLLFDVGGIGAALADERLAGLLRLLRSELSPGAYSEVVRALADHAGLAGERAGAPLDS